MIFIEQSKARIAGFVSRHTLEVAEGVSLMA
jgi:hypothetical protein